MARDQDTNCTTEISFFLRNVCTEKAFLYYSMPSLWRWSLSPEDYLAVSGFTGSARPKGVEDVKVSYKR